jgi:hypothetical protein
MEIAYFMGFARLSILWMMWIMWMDFFQKHVKICKITQNYIENKNNLEQKSINVEKPEGKRISTGLIT